jgi:hypothetical protein
MFPDTASFGGSILTMTVYPMPEPVERYCRLLLIMYLPFRTLDDLAIDGSYHKRFMTVIHSGILTDAAIDILNHIQMYYDTIRVPACDDPLESQTSPFRDLSTISHQDSSSEDEALDDGTDVLLGLFAAGRQTSSNALPGPPTLSLKALQKTGARSCGFKNLPDLHDALPLLPFTSPAREALLIPSTFISSLQAPPLSTEGRTRQQSYGTVRDSTYISRLMQLTYQNTKRRLHTNVINRSVLLSEDIVEAMPPPFLSMACYVPLLMLT